MEAGISQQLSKRLLTIRKYWQHPKTSASSLGNEVLLLSGLGDTGEGSCSAGVSQTHETVNALDVPR